MRGHPQAIVSRLPRPQSSRRWSWSIAEAIEGRRRSTVRRLVVIERTTREQRSACSGGEAVHGLTYRVRPW